MRGLIVTAHPDDSFIFAHNIRKSEPNIDWNDCVATYTLESARGIEFLKACAIMQSVPIFLGLPDTDEHLKFEFLNLDLKRYSTIITHNINGEYGNKHHKDVHNWVMSMVASQNWLENASNRLLVFAQNYKAADLTYTDEQKLKSPCLDIYARESYIMYNFDLINEGFVRIRI